jgi:hypothetical protein
MQVQKTVTSTHYPSARSAKFFNDTSRCSLVVNLVMCRHEMARSRGNNDVATWVVGCQWCW